MKLSVLFIIIAVVSFFTLPFVSSAQSKSSSVTKIKVEKKGTIKVDIPSGSLTFSTTKKDEVRIYAYGIPSDAVGIVRDKNVVNVVLILEKLFSEVKGNPVRLDGSIEQSLGRSTYNASNITLIKDGKMIPFSYSKNRTKSLASKEEIFTLSNSIRLDISVPASFNIDAKTGNGKISTTRLVTGDISAETEHGDISVSDVEGNVYAKTNSGNVQVNAISESATLETAVGNIEAWDVKGPCNVSSRGGNIKLGTIGGSARARTGNGTIDVIRAEGSCMLTATSMGDINVGECLGPLEARTEMGSIAVDKTYDHADLQVSVGGIVKIKEALKSVKARTLIGGIDVAINARNLNGDVSLFSEKGHISLKVDRDLQATISVEIGSYGVFYPILDRKLINLGDNKFSLNGGSEKYQIDLKASKGHVFLNHKK